jgi:isopenicillin-N N-acyltransferase-like protein
VRVVRAEGGPFERGVAIGRGFAAEIGASVAFYRNQFGRWGFDGSQLDALAAPFIEAADLRLPHELEILRGVAEGARVPFVDLFVPNAYEELEPLARPRSRRANRVERCSVISVAGPGSRSSAIARTGWPPTRPPWVS